MGVVVCPWLSSHLPSQWLLVSVAARTRRIANLVFFLSVVSPSVCDSMDLGRSGVWDSPMATDKYVKQFGWTFGGGRSGVDGAEALKRSNWDRKENMKYSSTNLRAKIACIQAELQLDER